MTEPAADTKAFTYSSSDGTKVEVIQSKEALDVTAHIMLKEGVLSGGFPQEFLQAVLPGIVSAASHFTRKGEMERVLGLVDPGVVGVVKVALEHDSYTMKLSSEPGDNILRLKFVMPDDLEDPENPEHWWNNGLYVLIDR